MGLETPSQAIGRIDPSSLVTPASAVVEPRATQALVDAFHNGVVTADDITSRIGELGKAKEKAQISGANLQAAQSTAALPGVPNAAKAAEEDVDFHRATVAYGPEAIQSFFKYAPLVPGYDGTPTTSDGKPDWVTVAREGANLEQQVNLKSQAALRSAVHKTETRKEGSTTYAVDVNSVGEDITDPNKKQALNAQATAPLVFKFIKPGSVSVPAPVATPSAPAPVTVTPVAPQPDVSSLNQVRANLANKFGSDAVVQLSEPDLLRLNTASKAEDAATPSPVVQPVAPVSAAKPTVELNSYIPGKGLVSGIEDKQLLTEAAGITDQLRKQGSYQVWNKSTPAWNAMQNIIGEINKIPIEQQRSGAANLNVKDLDLISNFIKLYDPEAVIREFKFDKLVTGQPLPDRLANWKATVLKAGHLTPETRQELVNVAHDMYAAKEQAIVPDLQMAAKRAQGAGLPIDTILNPREQELLAGKFQSGVTAPAPASAASSGVLALPSGRKIQRDANGNYFEVK
jgi:hypothetical protein